MAGVTTIQIQKTTKSKLKALKEYKRETYDEILNKLIAIARVLGREPKLKESVIKEIDEARKRIRKGEYYTLREVKEMLEMKV